MFYLRFRFNVINLMYENIEIIEIEIEMKEAK